MRITIVLLSLIFAACSRSERVLTLDEVSRPTRDMLDAEVQVRGFIFFHPEETLLCPKDEYGSAPFIQLSMSPSMRLSPGEGKQFRRGFDGKEVVVRGVLRVGPFGPLYRPTVYLEVANVEKG